MEKMDPEVTQISTRMLEDEMRKPLLSFVNKFAQLHSKQRQQFKEKSSSLDASVASLQKKQKHLKEANLDTEADQTKCMEHKKRLEDKLDKQLRVREKLDSELAAKRELCEALRQDAENNKKSEVEVALASSLDMYRNRLGFDIKRVRGNDASSHIELHFTQIDSKDPEKMFGLAIKLRPDKTFSVTDCQPMIEDLDILLGRLQKTLDWHQFFVSVRQRFTRLV